MSRGRRSNDSRDPRDVFSRAKFLKHFERQSVANNRLMRATIIQFKHRVAYEIASRRDLHHAVTHAEKFSRAISAPKFASQLADFRDSRKYSVRRTVERQRLECMNELRPHDKLCKREVMNATIIQRINWPGVIPRRDFIA